MAAEKAQSVQDAFLSTLCKNKSLVTVFLVNGIKLQGFVLAFDNFALLLRRDRSTQLVYKHAISTVVPVNTAQVSDLATDGGTRTLDEGGSVRSVRREMLRIPEAVR